MAFEMLVGLEVIDEEKYSEYRRQMTPLLQQAGGGFGYDFKIEETLKSPVSEKINRLFTIHFSDEAAMKAFFMNQQYQKIKANYFLAAVKSTTIIASYAA